jgi:hypothetical protein
MFFIDKNIALCECGEYWGNMSIVTLNRVEYFTQKTNCP